MSDTITAVVDLETTGLSPDLHQAYEVCIWRSDHPEPITMNLPHTLANAENQALRVGGYFERYFSPWSAGEVEHQRIVARLVHLLQGVTLVGANPTFDAAFLARFIGTAVWHYRLIDVSAGAMWLLGWDRPKGLHDTAQALRELGFQIATPDHSAEADVRATRDVYDALRSLHREQVATA